MNYKQAISYLYNLKEERINLGLSRINKLLFFMNVPIKDLKFIHVGGTNGKGSIVAMTSDVLAHNGFKTGVFTSPHLNDFRERIVVKTCAGTGIKTELISKKVFAEIVSEIKKTEVKIVKEGLGSPTFFEVSTAVMFAYFAKERIDIAVIEVGLGGRLDATNIIDPLLSVITNIGLEHTDRLGNTIEKIAKEKCGIIKKCRPVITQENNPKALKIIQKTAKKMNSDLIKVGKSDKISFKFKKIKGDLQYFDYKGINWQLKDVFLRLKGKHQIANAACVVAISEVLCNLGVKINEFLLLRALKNAVWPGRFETISENPKIIIDGAHNPPAATVLSQTIQDYYKKKELTLVLGMLYDKDVNGITNILFPLASNIVITSPDNVRAASVSDIAARLFLKNSQIPVFLACDVRNAIEIAKKITSREGLIVIAGSLYTIAQARKIVKNNPKNIFS